MYEFYTNDPEKDRERVREALQRSPAEMRLWLHAYAMIDAGMSYYCLCCGAREQSLQTGTTYDHRPDCPLYDIGRTLPEIVAAARNHSKA